MHNKVTVNKALKILIGKILDFKPDSGSVFYLNPLRFSKYVPHQSSDATKYLYFQLLPTLESSYGKHLSFQSDLMLGLPYFANSKCLKFSVYSPWMRFFPTAVGTHSHFCHFDFAKSGKPNKSSLWKPRYLWWMDSSLLIQCNLNGILKVDSIKLRILMLISMNIIRLYLIIYLVAYCNLKSFFYFFYFFRRKCLKSGKDFQNKHLNYLFSHKVVLNLVQALPCDYPN